VAAFQSHPLVTVPFRLFAAGSGLLIERGGSFVRPAGSFSLDAVFAAEDPVATIASVHAAGTAIPDNKVPDACESLHAPLRSQEVWAAGATYLKSKDARKAESRDAGGGGPYDRVYEADRPELFFKATRHRVADPGTAVRIRADSRWNVPEPELTLAVNCRGRIFGYTIGNDMSARDIEGENPLYLPQARVYDRCAALGPSLVISTTPPPSSTAIVIEILRSGLVIFTGATAIDRIKRPLQSLVEWLFRENLFPHGCYLMTGTGIVPPVTFSLQAGDEIRISIDPVGTLVNTVEG